MSSIPMIRHLFLSKELLMRQKRPSQFKKMADWSKLGKSSIKFTINDSDVVIDGALVGQRPEKPNPPKI